MNKKTKIILLIVLAVLLVGATGVGLFFFLNPKKTTNDIFTEAMQRNIENLTSFKNDEIKTLEKILTDENVKIKVSTDTKISEDDIMQSIKGDLYYHNEELYGLVSLFDGINSYDVEAVLKDSKLYHMIKDVYSRFYYTDVDMEEFSNFDTTQSNSLDTSVLFEYFLEAFDDQVKDMQLKEEETAITLGKRVYKVNKISADFTEKASYEMLKKFALKLKNDKNFSNIIDDAMSTAGEDFGSFNELINELDSAIAEADDTMPLFVYSMYLDGKDVLSNEFAITIEAEGTSMTMKFAIDSYANSDNNDVFEVYLSMMGMKMFTFKVEAVSDSKSEILLSIYSSFELNGIIESNDKEFNLEMSAKAPEYEDDGNLVDKEVFTLSINSEEIKKEKEYDFDFEFTSKDGDIESKFESSNTIYIGAEIPQYDISDSADISEMTDAEMEVFSQIFG